MRNKMVIIDPRNGQVVDVGLPAIAGYAIKIHQAREVRKHFEAELRDRDQDIALHMKTRSARAEPREVLKQELSDLTRQRDRARAAVIALDALIQHNERMIDAALLTDAWKHILAESKPG
jgi:hypothetical protein